MANKSKKLITLLESLKKSIFENGEYSWETSSAVDCIDYLIDFEKAWEFSNEK